MPELFQHKDYGKVICQVLREDTQSNTTYRIRQQGPENADVTMAMPKLLSRL